MDKLKIIEPFSKEIKALSKGHVLSTPSQGITGEIIFIGSGIPDDFEQYKDKIAGKIVLITTTFSNNPFKERIEHPVIKISRAASLHAKAILMAGLGSIGGGTGSFTGISKIPAACINKEDGAYLVRLLDKYQTVKVNLYLKNSIKNKISWNIIGEIAGQEKPNEEIIVGAHYDSWDTTIGALDNASGTAAVMELARVFSKHKNRLKRTIKFICFSGEEIGLRGSSAYVKQHAKELKRIILMLNIDPAGSTNYLVGGFSNLLQYLSDLSRESGFQNRAERYVANNTDCFPFVLSGVPAVWMMGKDRKGWIYDHNFYAGHTPTDSFDKIDIFDLKEALTVVAYTLLNITNIDKRPESHKSQKEVKKWLEEDADIVNTLNAGKLWPFDNKT